MHGNKTPGVHDVIACADLYYDRLRGLGVAGVKFGFLHWLASSPLQHSHTTVRGYRASVWWDYHSRRRRLTDGTITLIIVVSVVVVVLLMKGLSVCLCVCVCVCVVVGRSVWPGVELFNSDELAVQSWMLWPSTRCRRYFHWETLWSHWGQISICMCNSCSGCLPQTGKSAWWFHNTNISSVAKTPPDVSCLSVVSFNFNSTKCRAVFCC